MRKRWRIWMFVISFCLGLTIFTVNAFCAENPTTRDIQTALKNADFYNGPIDGKKNVILAQAIKNFQTTYDLEPDGIVGRKTWTLLSVFADKNAQTRTFDSTTAARSQNSSNPYAGDRRIVKRRGNQPKFELGATCEWANFEFSGDFTGELNFFRLSAIGGYFLNDWLEVAGSITYIYVGDEDDGASGWAFPISAVISIPIDTRINLAIAPFLGFATVEVKGMDFNGTILGFLAGIRYHLESNWYLNAGIDYIFLNLSNDNIDVDISVWMPDIGLSYYF